MPWKNYQTAVFDLAMTVTFNATSAMRVYGIEQLNTGPFGLRADWPELQQFD